MVLEGGVSGKALSGQEKEGGGQEKGEAQEKGSTRGPLPSFDFESHLAFPGSLAKDDIYCQKAIS